MTKPASRLSIRVQLPGEEEELPPPPLPEGEETVYLWDRIIVAALGAALLVTAVAVGGWYWLYAADPEPSRQVVPVVQSEAPEPAPEPSVEPDRWAPVDVARQEDPVARDAPVDEQPEAAVTQALAVEPAAVSGTQTGIQSPPVTTQVEEEVQGEEPSQPATASLQAEPTLDEEGSAAAPDEAAPVGAPGGDDRLASEAFDNKLAEVQIFSDRLARAQLATDVQDREPVDQAPAVVTMNEDGLIKMYFFTELQGMAGATLYYDWYLRGQRMARVVVKPHLDTMRAYSLKHIDRTMLGLWQVRLQTAEGEPLAVGEFEVR